MSGIDTRLIARDSLFLMSSLCFDGDDEEFRVKIRNISAGGLMAEGVCAPDRGVKLSVHLRNIGWITGYVAWLHGDRFGVAFEHEIDPKKVRLAETSGDYRKPAYLANHQQMIPDPARMRKL